MGSASILTNNPRASHLRVDLRLVGEHLGQVVDRHVVAELEAELRRLAARLLHHALCVRCGRRQAFAQYNKRYKWVVQFLSC